LTLTPRLCNFIANVFKLYLHRRTANGVANYDQTLHANIIWRTFVYKRRKTGPEFWRGQLFLR